MELNSRIHSRPEAPVISVVMPTFNCAEHVGEAIQSMIDQSWQEWELIVVDDASTDSTVEVIKAFLPDSRIRLICCATNQGSGACRNLAIEHAGGEYIGILDADDVCRPDRFEKQLAIFLGDEEVSVVASQVLEFGRWGGPIVGQWPTAAERIRSRQRTQRMPVAHPTVVFRKEVFDRYGGYDVACRRAQDFALFLRLSQQKIVCLETPLVMYRTRRPVSLAYVVKNQKFVELAKLRHALRNDGVAEAELPLEPRIRIGTLIKSVRSYLIRSSKEFLGRKPVIQTLGSTV